MSASDESSSFSAESYFSTQPPPAGLEQDIAGVKQFVQRQASSGRNVVLVTVSLYYLFNLLSNMLVLERWNDRPIGAQCVRTASISVLAFGLTVWSI